MGEVAATGFDPLPADDAARQAWINERIAYIGPIARRLTEERTALESKIIPVSAYIITACVESFLRYPDLMRRIAARHGAGGDRQGGPPSRLPGEHRLPVVDLELLPDRPFGLGGH